jgi:hypothetical protein
MIDRRHFSRLYDADVEVTRSEGDRTGDGWAETSTTTVLLCQGNLQEQGRTLRERAAYYDTGDVLLHCSEDVGDVRPSDEVTITTGDRTLTGTVEQVTVQDASLLVSL